jgi:hypothetical protein
MSKRVVASILLSAFGLIGTSGLALGETIGRFECSVVGTSNPEPIGDREGHSLVAVQTSCLAVDGLLKGAVFTGINITEWDGEHGTYRLSGGVHRAAAGLAVTEPLEGTATAIMKDGKRVGNTGSGKIIFRFASGAFAQLAGKTFNLSTKTTGPNRFEQEYSE